MTRYIILLSLALAACAPMPTCDPEHVICPPGVECVCTGPTGSTTPPERDRDGHKPAAQPILPHIPTPDPNPGPTHKTDKPVKPEPEECHSRHCEELAEGASQ